VTDLDIRDVSLGDTDAVRAVYPILRAGEQHGREGTPFWSEREFVTMQQAPLPDMRRRLLVASDGGRVVGGATVLLPQLDNLDKVYIHPVVHPDERGRGVGSAIEATLRTLADAEGRPTMIAVSSVPADRHDDHPYRRFAESRGYVLANIEIERVLRLPVSDALLDSVDAEVAPHLAGYRVETIDGPIPDDLVESYCQLLGQLVSEAPTGDLEFEPEVMPVEGLRAREKSLAEQGRTVFTTVAIDGSGEAVAHTSLAVSPDDPANVMQWDTLVRSDHRGHRLGLALKARNLRAVQAAFPDRQRVWTQNSEVNAHMVSINERLGFEPFEVILEFQRKSRAA
jgi:GNAT superfamily N-acetyltransferase